MPRIDPVTGCEVMTLGEFLNSEAAHEGKGRSGGEILDDIMKSLHEECAKQEAEMRRPETALELLNEALKEENEARSDNEMPALPKIVLVVRVVNASCSQSCRSSHTAMDAEVRCADGNPWYARMYQSHWSGTMLDPPEEDGGFMMARFMPMLSWMAKEPWQCMQCERKRSPTERHWTHVRHTDDQRLAVHLCPSCNGYNRAQAQKRMQKRLMKRGRKH